MLRCTSHVEVRSISYFNLYLESPLNVFAMFRTDGAGELYTYLPLTDQNAAAQLAVPGSIENTDYGFSVGRGSYSFPAGEWTTVLQRIQLNDPGEYNGQIRLWVNGESVIELYNVSLRNSSDGVVQGMHFQTFFGGAL